MSAEEWGREETPRSVPDLLYLNLLVNDAAGRAAAMLAGAAPAADGEDQLVDAVRLLATPEGSPHAGRATRLTGLAFARDRWWPAPGAAEPPGVAWKAALRARSLRRVGG